MKSLALAAALALVSSASLASQYNGRWTGTGEAVTGSCSNIEISVTVDGNTIDGEVLTIDRSFEVKGNVSGDGEFNGEVVKIGFTVAELTGAVDSSRGSGQWRTLRGEDCSGTFTVKKRAG